MLIFYHLHILQVEGAKGTAAGTTSEGVLANFFNSLLNKKTGAAGGGMGRGATAVRSDAAAELDRMTRAKKMLPPGGSDQESTGTP